MAAPVADRLLELLESSPGLEVLDLTGGAPELNEHFPFDLDPDALSTTLAIEVVPGHVDFYVDDELVGAVNGDAELAGRVGLFGQDTRALFEELRLRY